MKLRSSLGKLEKAKDKLELLLVEADKETIKENIPEAPRAKCLEAWAKAGNICLRIKHAISQKTRQNFDVYHSAAKKSLTRTKAMVNLLDAILYSLTAA